MPTYSADEEARRRICFEMHAGFANIDPDWLTSLYTDDATIHMVPLEPIVGRTDIHDMFRRWRDDYPAIHSEILRAHAEDDVVLTEWVDHYNWVDKRYDIPIMGAVQFQGLKISSWRLFFDRIMADMVGGQYPDAPALS